MNDRVREVIVVGGGISGLTVAWHLKKAGVDVCLLESDPTVGGCTRTDRRDGFLLEKGPFNVIVRDPTFEALLDDFAKEVRVVTASPAARIRYIYRHGRLHAVPTNPIALATTRLLSFGARCRLLIGLVRSPRGGACEETIEQVAARRFGQEVADTLVSAVISGIFAGDIGKLNLRACFPSVADVDAQAHSLIGYGLRSAFRSGKKKKHRRRWRGLVSIDGGLGALTSALGERLGADLLTGCTAEEVAVANGGYKVAYRTGTGETRSLQCRHLVIASPVAEAGRLLVPLVPQITALTSSIRSTSLVVLNLGFRRSDVGHPLEGFGFLVPRNEPDFPLMGVLWADSIFPHHAPPDHRLIRVFIGGARDPEAVSQSDEQLIARASEALRDLLRISGEPVLVDVCRYETAIPQYALGHADRIDCLRTVVATRPGLYVVGNYLEGVSLNDCVRLATNTAERVIRAAAAGTESTGLVRAGESEIAAVPLAG